MKLPSTPGTDLPQPLPSFSQGLRLMGNRFEFIVCDDSERAAADAIDAAVAEVRRIENLLTTFSASSQTAAINNAAGLYPVSVDPEVFALISRSNRISALTQGAFDLSYGGLSKQLWNFDSTITALPDRALAKAAVRLINWRNIILEPSTHSVFLKEKGMRIGFGGIGKGYAAERARQLLQNRGIASGVVNAAGDLAAWGCNTDGRPWTIGIADPRNRDSAFSSLEISGLAVATSGTYEKFAEINGKRYSHTIDPRSGYPASGIHSVTIICPNAELADALATPVMVMGVRAGLHMLNQMQGVAAVIVDDHFRLFTTTNITLT